MNRNKKIAMAVVATVMAGTMVFSLAGCKKDPTKRKPTGQEGIDKNGVYVDEYGDLKWDETTKVNMNIGYNSATTSTAFSATANLPFKDAGTTAKLPSGVEYTKGALKPNMETFEKNLKMDLVDVFTGKKTADNLGESKTTGFQYYDLITADVSKIVSEANNKTLLNLGEYLDYMPNFKHFVESSSLIKLSVIKDFDDATGKIDMYYAPYFDGVNDIERYCLMRKDYVTELLDHASDFSKNGGTITFAAQATAKGAGYDGTAASVQSYMGKTGEWKVETTNPNDTLKTGFVKVNYAAVISALGDNNSALKKAVVAAGATNPQTASGNIVDIQNDIIKATNGAVTGEHLLKVLREYIKVAYQYSDKENGTYAQLYGAKVGSVDTKLSDVFNSAFGAWDVDLYVALSRCFVTCGNVLGPWQSGEHASKVWAFLPRAEALNRSPDLWRFAAQLYGIRGLESRYGYSYVDSSGNLRDARYNQATWEALDNFSKLAKEGLVPTTLGSKTGELIGSVSGSSSCSTISIYDGTDSHYQTLASYDYTQTQTALGYDLSSSPTYKYRTNEYVKTTDGYNYTAVINPVSRYNTDDKSTVTNLAITSSYNSLDQNKTIMRFTESWRSVKSAGICVPVDVKSDAKKLSAVLGFIDYLYSNDGRIINTYGPMAANNNITTVSEGKYTSDCGGFWYGTPVTAAELGVKGDVNDMKAMFNAGVVETFDYGKQYTIKDEYASKAFVFEGKLYKGTYYNGMQVPTVTDATLKSYYGYEVNGSVVSTAIGSYTGYAQQIIGSCLGFAEKMQSFEFQLTSPMGIAGAAIVGQAIGNGTVKHVEMKITEDKWYTEAPTGLPLTDTQTTTIDNYKDFDKIFQASSSTYTNLLIEVMGKGIAGASAANMVATDTHTFSDKASVVAAVKEWAPLFQDYYNAGWSDLMLYYNTFMVKK